MCNSGVILTNWYDFYTYTYNNTHNTHTHTGVNEIRPETTYQDLRAASGNSGNVVENKSLYWHPTPYEYDPITDIYKKDKIFFGSSYYIWTTGQTTAFPDGFKMVAGFNGDPKSRAEAECVNPSPCERANCGTTDTSFFPGTACAELEVKMVFPTCWNGVDSDSDDHMSHVSYDLEDGQFDGDCPDAFPVKLPEVHFYFRIAPYSGGQHVFSDGTPYYHADYFSGWKAAELQNVLVSSCVFPPLCFREILLWFTLIHIRSSIFALFCTSYFRIIARTILKQQIQMLGVRTM